MFGPELQLIECQELYNLLNEGSEYPKLSDPYYLYLIDCRPRSDYNQGHIICAKNIKTNDDGSFRLPYEAELHSRNNIVVYDGNTSSLLDDSRAIECARFLFENGSKYSVKILRGGYETFSRYFPFLRTQQIIYMPRELDEIKTYPSEIIPGLLYLGNFRHGTDASIRKDLKLRAYVDCTGFNDTFKFVDNKWTDYLKIQINDEPNESIKDNLDNACNFIDLNIRDRKLPCLVYSELGISRAATIVIAYLVYSENISVQEAFDGVLKCKKIQPQVGFLEQIAEKFSDRIQLF